MDIKNTPQIPWWQPGLVLFARLSAWIGGPVIIAVMVGKWLDRVFNSSPWLFLICVASSFILSMIVIVRIGMKEMNKIGEKK
jgi:F0F1-type ATP synthase assembly protein I